MQLLVYEYLEELLILFLTVPISSLQERKEMSETEAGNFVRRLRSTFTAVERLPMPTIALVEGHALGGGAELAMAADIRVACASKATFSFPEVGCNNIDAFFCFVAALKAYSS